MLTGGACLLSGADWAFAQSTRTDEAAARMLALLQGCTRHVSYQGGTVAALLAGRTRAITSLRAEVTDLAALSLSIARSHRTGFDLVEAGGSTYCLRTAGRHFELEVSESADFANAVSGAAGQAVFAHDALSLVPSARSAQDPLRAGSALRLLRRASGATALDDVLRGRVDAAETGLVPDAAFLQTEKAVLAGTVANRAEAEACTRVFFSRLTALAESLPPDQLAALASAPLLRGAVRQTLSVSLESVAQKVAAHGAEAPAPQWLAAALRGEIAAGRAQRWIASNSVAQSMQSSAALREASKLLTA